MSKFGFFSLKRSITLFFQYNSLLQGKSITASPIYNANLCTWIGFINSYISFTVKDRAYFHKTSSESI